MHLLVLGRHVPEVAVKHVQAVPVQPGEKVFQQPEHRSHLEGRSGGHGAGLVGCSGFVNPESYQ